MATALYFSQFVLAVMLLQCLIWALLVVLPFLLTPPSTFAWSQFRQTSALNMLQGEGLGSTFLFYGMCWPSPPLAAGKGCLKQAKIGSACRRLHSRRRHSQQPTGSVLPDRIHHGLRSDDVCTRARALHTPAGKARTALPSQAGLNLKSSSSR